MNGSWGKCGRGERPVFSFRPKLEDPSHKRAREILQRVPEGQKNASLVQAIREELRDVQCFGTGKTEGRPEEIPAQMLDFLSSMEDGM